MEGRKGVPEVHSNKRKSTRFSNSVCARCLTIHNMCYRTFIVELNARGLPMCLRLTNIGSKPSHSARSCFLPLLAPIQLRFFIPFLLIAIQASTQMSVPMRGTPNGLAPASATSSASLTVTGTVLNAASGLPIPRALVQLSGRSLLTDHEGKFEFDQFTPTGNAVLQV